jgi:hypothetical protein
MTQKKEKMQTDINMKSISELLPIGSVITLKGPDRKPLMVYSRMIKTVSGEEFDYLLCPYPEGFMSDELSFFANTGDISGLLFIGFQTKREFELREVLKRPFEEREGAWDWTEC